MSDHSAPSSQQDSSRSPTPRTSRPSLNYEFVDSQDPNTKSQIQRHTAQHAVQQRRQAARRRLLRENSTPRPFEWQRRSDAETESPTTSSSIAGSLPASPPTEAPTKTARITRSSISGERIQEHDREFSPTEQLSTVTMPYNDVEEALLRYYSSVRCMRRSHAAYFARLLDRVRDEPSAAYMIIAYAAAHRAGSGGTIRSRDLSLAADYKVKCLALVNSRLTAATGIDKSSDQNIQAVLFLLAYESRYGSQEEVATHLSGLRGMIAERGGLRVFEQQVTLRHQLFWVQLTGTASTILDCAPFCDFPAIPIAPEAAPHTWAHISLTMPLPNNEDLCQFFIHKLRQFRSNEHLNILRQVFGPVAAVYQIASATLERGDLPFTLWGHLLNESRLACLFYINALILTSYNSVQNAKDVLYDTIILHFGVDYPTSESPLGLLWVFLYSLQLSDERNRDTLRIVLDMMQAARMLQGHIIDLVIHVLLQLLFYPNEAANASLSINETEIVNDIMRGKMLEYN